MKSSLDKGVATPEMYQVRDAPSGAGEARPAQTFTEDENIFLGQYFHEQDWGKALLSSPVEQSLEKSLEGTARDFAKH